MPQASVVTTPPKALEGLIADAVPYDIMTAYVDLSAGIKPGRLVERTTTDFGGKTPASAATLTTNVLGVSVHSHKAKVTPSSSDNEIYENKCEIPVLRHGRIWVKSENAVTPASPVFVRVASGAGGTEIGAFRTGADTATAVAWTFAKFLTTTTGTNEFVLLEVNM
jgi:hypothetical protein